MDDIIEKLSDTFISNNSITEKTTFRIERIRARKLICPERMDLGAKLIYVSAKEKQDGGGFAKEVYAKHIEAFSEGTFAEPGDSSKRSLSDYLRVFDELIESIRENGVDGKKSLIPVNAYGVIMDGAHRVACASFFDQEIDIIVFPELKKKISYDYSYFVGRKLSIKMLGYMTNEILRYDLKSVYCMVLWPRAKQEFWGTAVKKLKKKNYKILFEKKVLLTYQGLRNIMLSIYGHQQWIGTVENGFPGLYGKVDECFAPGKEMLVVYFEGGSLNDVLKVKEEIRSVFGIDKHSCHISDNIEETRQIGELLLNPSGIHALNYGKPCAFPIAYREIFLEAKKLGFYCGINATLAFYGIEDRNDYYSEKCAYFENDPRTYFVYNQRRIPSIFVLKEGIEKQDKRYGVIKKLADDTLAIRFKCFREKYRASLFWRGHNGVLKVKRCVYRILKRIGLR